MLHHLGQACFVGAMMALAAAVLGVAVLASGVKAPGWIAAQLAQRINSQVAGQALSFDSIALRLAPNMAPRVTLRDVSVRGEAGQRLLELSAFDVTLSRGALLRGAVRPVKMRLDGAQLVLRRRKSGALSIALDGMAGMPGALPEQIGTLLSQPRFAALREVSARNLRLRYEDARAGRAWSADGGQVRLSRDGDAISLRGNVTVLGARDYATAIEVTYEGEVGSNAAEFGVRLEDMPARELAGQSPALLWLSALDAPLSGAIRASVDTDGRLGPVSATLQIGAGALHPNPNTRPIPFRAARSYFTYDPDAREIRFSELSVDSGWGRARAQGTARLVGPTTGLPDELQAQITFDEIVADPPDLYPEPIRLEAASLQMRLRLDPFELSVGAARLVDQGRTVRLSGGVRARPDGWGLSLDAGMDSLAPARLLALWPRALKPKTRDWIAENVHEVALRDIQLALRARPKAPPDVFLGFGFDDLRARYVRDVPPITAASGHASISDNRFALHLDTGHVVADQGGPIDISGSAFVIPDIRVKQGPAQARLKTESTITAALSLLDAPPFRFLSKAGQPVTLAEGRARLEGRLDFPVRPKLTPDEVAFEVTGALHDVASDTLVEGRDLRAPRLRVEASERRVEIGGDIRVDDVPLGGTWTMPLGPDTGGASRVQGRIALSPQSAEAVGIDLGSVPLTGAGRGALTVEFAKGTPPRFTLTSDLGGLGLRLPQLGWSLSKTQTGQLDVTGRLGATPRIDDLRVEAAGLAVRGSVTLGPGGRLERAEFGRVEIGDWLRAPVSLIGRGKGRAPRIEVTGGQVDLRRTSLFGGAGGGSGAGSGTRGGPVALRLDRLQVSDTITLAPFSADLDLAGAVRGRFSGRLDGTAPIRGDVVPVDGGSAFRIRSNDAAGVLAAADLLKHAREGRLDMTLTPAPRPGTYDGVLEIDDLRVTEAPALAALLNTISVVGLLEQFDGQGLHFESVDARFRLTPARLTLLEGSAVGAALGISMDGYYDLSRRRMDMQGVISPVYLLNGIGRVFTRPGEGLIGFNYTLKGAASNPQVAVNPLSALTPGFLREMFRRPVPQVEGAGPPVVIRERAPDGDARQSTN